MKGRFILATVLIGLVHFATGIARSFLGAYVFVKQGAKFTGDGAFQIGLWITTGMSVCLMLAFLATAPVYVRTFGERTLRHLLIYSAAFAVIVPLILQSPPLGAMLVIFWRILEVLTPVGPWQVLIPPLIATMVSALFFAGAVWVVTFPFRQRTHFTQLPRSR